MLDHALQAASCRTTISSWRHLGQNRRSATQQPAAALDAVPWLMAVEDREPLTERQVLEDEVKAEVILARHRGLG